MMGDSTEVIYSAVSACVDCVSLPANGDVPEDRSELPDLIAQQWAGFQLALGCSEECCDEEPVSWVSWSPCEVCGSSPGGAREHVTPFPIVA